MGKVWLVAIEIGAKTNVLMTEIEKMVLPITDCSAAFKELQAEGDKRD